MVPLGRGADGPPDEKSRQYLRFCERLVEPEQRSGLEEDRELRDPAWRQRSKTQEKTVELIQIGARRRARLLMSNCCFSTKDSAAMRALRRGRTSLGWWATSGGKNEQVNHQHRR